MIDAVLARKNANLKMKITVKSVVSLGIIALAVVLPQIVHITLGAGGGVKWLPMYLPVLLGGCLLGWQWGLGVGILSPIASCLITSAFTSPMPAVTRLPYMIAELATKAAVSGLFSDLIAKKAWTAFGAVLTAAVCGRIVFLALAAIFQSGGCLGADTDGFNRSCGANNSGAVNRNRLICRYKQKEVVNVICARQKKFAK